MLPTLNGIDHVHLYVSDKQAAADWYRQVLGMQESPELAHWNTASGPRPFGHRHEITSWEVETISRQLRR